MSAFPPPAEDQVTLANWRTAPFNRWAFHHVREIVPSADIPHDLAHVRPLTRGAGGLESLRIGAPDGASTSLGSGPALGLDDLLAATGTDGIVILHRGAIVLEGYANGMTERSPHILMSVSKSMLGLLAAVLAAQGALDADRLATDYVPELRETAWAGARVAQLLDMRTAVAFDEDYLATSGPIVAYRKATGWNRLEPGEPATDLRSFLLTLRGSRLDVAYPAPAVTGRGAALVVTDFDNVGEVPLPTMIEQCREAVDWTARNAASFGGDPDRIYLAGHSSGAHLASCVLLGNALLKGALLISGMYDLHAPLLSARSKYVKITPEELDAASAMRHLGRINCPVSVAWSVGDSPEFRRQAQVFSLALQGMGRLASRSEIFSPNHFDAPRQLADPGSDLSAMLYALMKI